MTKAELKKKFNVNFIDVFKYGIARARKENKWGYITQNGRLVAPFIYDNVDLSFFNDRARVEKNGKLGVINKKGEEIIPCKYERINAFYYSLSPVVYKSKYGCVDKNGKEVLPCIFDDLFVTNEGELLIKTVIDNHRIVFNKNIELVNSSDKVYLFDGIFSR